MNLYNKKYLYVNGSSVSAGGGFESNVVRQDVRDRYEKIGISIPDSQVECSYPYIISQKLGLELINESKSGSGVDRLIRKTLEYILKNDDKLNQTIFILEIQSGIRLDWYVRDWNKYGILNAAYNINDKKHGTIYPFTLVKEWYHDNPTEQHEWNENYRESINGYLNNFFDHDIHFKRESDKLIMFLSFLNQMKLDYLVSLPDELDSEYKKVIHNILSDKNNLNKLFLDMNLWSFSHKFNLLIKNEINNTDNHLGYYGNIKIAKIISNFILNNDYILKIYNIYNKSDFHLFKHFFVHTDIILKRVDNIDNSNCIFLNNIDVNSNKNDIEEITNIKTQLNELDLTNKKFLICYYHERMSPDVFKNKINNLTSILGINSNQILLIDSSISEVNDSLKVPLEFKLKQYNVYFTYSFVENKKNILHNDRNKKFSFLVSKPNVERVYIFDKIAYHYNDISLLRNENIIAVNFPYSTKIFNQNINFNIKGNDLNELKLPWKLDESREIYGNNKLNGTIHNYYQSSIFSIIVETASDYLPDNMMDDHLINDSKKLLNFQISEKSLLPILNGNLPFIVHDGMMYEKLEEIGFNFGYLKEIFNIDYKPNSFKQNADSVSLILDFVKNKSIDELNEIRKNNIKYIENNFKILINIFSGDISNNEEQFLNNLFNESNIIY
jgi:hypothetical protein